MPRQTKIKLIANYATGISSSAAGANIDGLAFNMEYIAKRNPALARTLVQLYEEAKKLEVVSA